MDFRLWLLIKFLLFVIFHATKVHFIHINAKRQVYNVE